MDQNQDLAPQPQPVSEAPEESQPSAPVVMVESTNSAPPTSAPPKKFDLPDKVKSTLLLFTLTGAVVLGAIPHLSSKTPDMPPFRVFLISGLVMIALTAVLFLVLNRLNLGFGRTALVMAFGYNAVIAVIKFVLSPRALYLSDQHNPISTAAGDPNTIFYYIFTGMIILLLYITVFRLIYRFFRRKLEREGLSAPPPGLQAPPQEQVVKGPRPYVMSLVLFTVKTVVICVAGGAVILLPLAVVILVPYFAVAVVSSSAAYLGYVFTTLGVPVAIAIALAVFLAYKGFADVEKQVIVTGNTALMASFLWLGVSLIVLYHILWIVFMLTLVHIWPFNTYSPK